VITQMNILFKARFYKVTLLPIGLFLSKSLSSLDCIIFLLDDAALMLPSR
ncbi:4988_t:CDS:1, partial [Dentiscutata heterogama]